MKRFILILFFFGSSYSLMYSQGYNIESLTVDIYLNKEGNFDVVENYVVNYQWDKHGIFRYIPTHGNVRVPGTNNMVSRQLYLTDIDVPGYKYKVSKSGNPMRPSKVEIKIGDKNKTLTGRHEYEIKYRVHNAYLFERDSIVIFYWNVLGTDWDTDFEQLTLRVHAPEMAETRPNNAFIYYGMLGGQKYEDVFSFDYKRGLYEVKSKSRVSARGDLTVQLNLPIHLIEEVDYGPPVWKEYGWLGILMLVLFRFYRVWDRHGRDDKVVATTSYYAPEGMDPAMSGYLLADKSNPNLFVSLFPHWAGQGYILIEEIPKNGVFGKADMKLIKKKPLPSDAEVYEKTVFDELFRRGDEVLISSLKEKFYTTMNTAKLGLDKSSEKYYHEESEKIRRKEGSWSGFLAVGGTIIAYFIWGGVAATFTFLVFSIVAGMSFYLRKKNDRGNMAYSELLGFRKFIELAELPQIKMLLKDDPGYFEKTVGYAVAFNQLKGWAAKFAALNVPPPDWYSSSSGMASMNSFSNSLDSGLSQARSTMVSSPSSSGSGGGGGSSGGGFGGGGGGSW